MSETKYLFSNENWKLRRRVMYLSLLWLTGNIQYLILAGDDTVLNQQLAIAMLGAIVSIIGMYVFGAVWDDNNKRATISNPGDT